MVNNNNIYELINKFEKIKKMGWIKSVRPNSTGIGATMEKMLGIDENRNQSPDYKGIEIKTKRAYSKAYTALFNCTPKGKEENEIRRLKELYGYIFTKARQYRVLNNSIYANCITKIGIYYFFKLHIDKKNQRINLLVYDIYMNLIDSTTYWTFDVLKEKLYNKLSLLAFIDAQRKMIENWEFFKYYKISLYKLKGFDEFIDLIEKGKIRVTFKINVYLSGERKGEIHDHGTSFDIEECNLLELFDRIY